jgi:AraC-like DNA-binding protein
LIFNPEILYGTSEYFQYSRDLPVTGGGGRSDHSEDSPGSHPQLVSESALEDVDNQLSIYMGMNKPFLKPGYKLLDLSKDTGIPIYKISACVNRRKNQNFFGYLNQFRIDYFLEKVKTKEYEFKTLEAIAEECGFQNRTTFIRVFKSVMGVTPTEYIHKR